jgi:hypothetical protein
MKAMIPVTTTMIVNNSGILRDSFINIPFPMELFTMSHYFAKCPLFDDYTLVLPPS